MTESDEVAAPLSLSEGVLLGYALVSAVAQRSDVRVLAIKGPVSEYYDLRDVRQSMDIDYLVDPRGVPGLRSALEERGWIERVNTSVGVIAQHSFTMHHATWPCELDLHHHFPGFLAEPQAVFDRLWDDRNEIVLAGSAVTAAGKSSMIAVAGLHILRDRDSKAHELDDLVTRLNDAMTAADRGRLKDLAALTGSSETLMPLFDGLGITPEPSGASSDELLTWRMRSHVTREPSIGWVHNFMTSPLRAWPGLLRRGLLLTESEIRDAYPDLGPGVINVWRGRMRRWRRGFPFILRAFRTLRDARRLAQLDAAESMSTDKRRIHS